MIGLVVLGWIIVRSCIRIGNDERKEGISIQDATYEMETLSKVSGKEEEWSNFIFENTGEKNEVVTNTDLKNISVIYPLMIDSTLKKNNKKNISLVEWNTYYEKLIHLYADKVIERKQYQVYAVGKEFVPYPDQKIDEKRILTPDGILLYKDQSAPQKGTIIDVFVYENKILKINQMQEQEFIIKNILITNAKGNMISWLFKNYEITYEADKEYQYDEQIADLTVCDNRLKTIQIKNEKINGRILRASNDEIEIEGYKPIPCSKDMKLYRLYGTLQEMSIEELRIGYAFTDFVIENNEIQACLMMKEEYMDTIRVLLKTSDYQGNYHEQFSGSSDCDCILKEYQDGMEISQSTKKAGELIQISSDQLDMGKRFVISPTVLGGSIYVSSIRRAQGEPVYSGKIEIEKTKNGLQIINELLLEEYLYKVVPSEMPASYEMEALKAQAVCARTYAYGKMMHAGIPECGAHVDDSTGYQVYNNMEKQKETTQAVRETIGDILFYQGQPILTYYYSTSCGSGADASVWGNAEETETPYLQAGRISEKETTEFSMQDESSFRKFITSIQEADYEKSLPWYRWTYQCMNVDVDVLYERIKKCYEKNSAYVLTRHKDQSFQSMPVEAFKKIKQIQIVERGKGGIAEELEIETEEGVIRILTEYNIRQVLCDGKTMVQRLDQTEAEMNQLLPSAYFVIDTFKEGKNVIGYNLSGGGYGHGVGMSQNAANQMAKKGMQYQEILSYFFASSEIDSVQDKGEAKRDG